MNSALRKAGIEERRFNTGEVELNYSVGPDNGPAILLLPGQALSWESYQRSLPLLARDLKVFAVDIRGHGKSGWTPGAYNFQNLGRDMQAFLEQVVKRPAIISGNSSGGLIALWLAAYSPACVSGIILEDTPVFSAEWPRLRDDCWVYRVFQRSAEHLGSPKGRDMAAFFKNMEVPVEGSQRVLQFPGLFGNTLAGIIRAYQWLRPGRPVDIPFLPPEARMLTKCLSIYDPGFSKAFVDGSACEGFSHADALSRVKCPVLLLQANWFRHPQFGLVGAMDDSDVARLRALVPNCEYRRITSGHMIHFEKPREYVREVTAFAASLSR